jgi:hypothetical protein
MMEAFVYCWTDWRDEKLYVGFHKGFSDDGYICSSKPMKAEYKQRPEDFTRQIVASGTVKDMHNFERILLQAADVCHNEHYYNKIAIAWPLSKNDLPKRKRPDTVIQNKKRIGEKNPFYNRKHTEATLAKMRATWAIKRGDSF